MANVKTVDLTFGFDPKECKLKGRRALVNGTTLNVLLNDGFEDAKPNGFVFGQLYKLDNSLGQYIGVEARLNHNEEALFIKENPLNEIVYFDTNKYNKNSITKFVSSDSDETVVVYTYDFKFVLNDKGVDFTFKHDDKNSITFNTKIFCCKIPAVITAAISFAEKGGKKQYEMSIDDLQMFKAAKRLIKIFISQFNKEILDEDFIKWKEAQMAIPVEKMGKSLVYEKRNQHQFVICGPIIKNIESIFGYIKLYDFMMMDRDIITDLYTEILKKSRRLAPDKNRKELFEMFKEIAESNQYFRDVYKSLKY